MKQSVVLAILCWLVYIVAGSGSKGAPAPIQSVIPPTPQPTKKSILKKGDANARTTVVADPETEQLLGPEETTPHPSRVTWPQTSPRRASKSPPMTSWRSRGSSPALGPPRARPRGGRGNHTPLPTRKKAKHKDTEQTLSGNTFHYSYWYLFNLHWLLCSSKLRWILLLSCLPT